MTQPEIVTMLNPKSFFDRRSASARRPRPGRRARPGRPRADHRLQVAAEISLLEPRRLLSTGGTTGHHGAHAGPLQRSSSHLIDFAGYQWETNYHHNEDSGYFDNGQQWAPQNVTVKNGQMHLELKTATVGGKYTALSSAEAVLVGTSSGQPFNPGYGTYLVSAETRGSFDRLASNNGAIFGAFTYESLRGNGHISGSNITGLPASVVATLKPGMAVTGQNYKGDPLFHKGTTIQSIQGNTVVLNKAAIGSGPHTIYFKDQSLTNGHRELDLMEASRFGIHGDPNDGQFTLQPHEDNPLNVHRFFMADQGQITLVMKWDGPGQPVTFSQYNGLYTLNDLPANAHYSWTTPSELNPFIPNTSHQTYHLNLWRAYWKNPPDPHHEEVTVTNFQYAPLT
jgi:hypothetical protein